MTKIKIASDPYEQMISILHFNEIKSVWEGVIEDNPTTHLRDDITRKKIFLPFKIKEFIDIIIKDYHDGSNKIEIEFEGTDDEYSELHKVCNREDVADKVELRGRTRELANASVIVGSIKKIFEVIRPIIKKTIGIDEGPIHKDLSKIDDALQDIVPICVYGNYSSGKSTFINSMIGYEVLPKAGEPVTAKIYKISRSIDDTARVAFEYQGEEYDILFKEGEISFVKGDPHSAIAEVIREKSGTDADMFAVLGGALEAINSYDKENDSDHIGDVIVIDVPFSEMGILGKSKNNFVIFDTPGQNSNTHRDHAEILKTALESLSNGIPIWMSIYDQLDSNDNAELSEEIWGIDALDKRFTMIIVNKADDAELDDMEEKRSEIMEYEAVKKNYSNGVYFLSAALGLGAKLGGKFKDRQFKKLYHQKEESFSDTSSEFYETLYKYNIMPDQIKDEAMQRSLACSDLVYANSGLFCIENAMDDFATRYASYNKCRMVKMFIDRIVEEVQRNIEGNLESIEESKKELEEKLGSQSAELINRITEESYRMDTKFFGESVVFADQQIKQKESSFCVTAEALKVKAEEIRTNIDEEDIEAQMEEQIEKQKETLRNSKEAIRYDAKKALDDIRSWNWHAFTQKIKNIRKTGGQMLSAMEEVGTKGKLIDKTVSSKLMQYVYTEYKQSIEKLYDDLKTYLVDLWEKNVGDFRDALEELISGSSALSEEQRQVLNDIVAEFRSPDALQDSSAEELMKEDFLKGYFLGLPPDFFESGIVDYFWDGAASIDEERLASYYNEKMKADVNKMATKTNDDCHIGFKNWYESLLATVQQRITEFNPELASLAADIKQKRDEINSWESDSHTLNSAVSTICDMMSWKDCKDS